MPPAARPGFEADNPRRDSISESMAAAPLLNQFCKDERQRIQRQFESGTGARETVHALCKLADRSIHQLFLETFGGHHAETPGFCLLALGGYGREHLFPYSDLDILFLFSNEEVEQRFQSPISDFCRALWDLGFRVSSAGRLLEECKRIEEENAEFHLALLDRRFLAGDHALFTHLDKKVLPVSEARARRFLLMELHRLTQERLAHFGNTIFHLEPNVKEAPGGLRDYQAANWLRQITGEKKETALARGDTAEAAIATAALEFLSAIRCFLHYSNGRNDNTLTYEFQAVAAQRSLPGGDVPRNPAQWMRLYFRHARTLNRQLLRLAEQIPGHPPKASEKHRAPASPALLKKLLGAARGLKDEPDYGRPFAVRNGQLEVPDQSVLFDRATAFSLFAEAARTGKPISHEAERSIAYVMSHPELWARNNQVTWTEFREVLTGKYPGLALRPMYRLGLLADVLPEFRMVDSLVVRDFYHRYTVDEHSLRAIEQLQQLTTPKEERDKYFANLWESLEHRELLVLALLLHDIGKGMPVENHVIGSLQALDSAALHLQLDPQEKDEVRFLIEHHLDMSATLLRRDIFDPETIVTFSSTVSTVERLARLCLLTYADIHAVNPEALTPWKAEMLWQLFAATYNQLNRSLDRDRLHSIHEASALDQVLHLTEGAERDDIERFLEGFPRRYLAVHPPAEIAAHFSMYKRLGDRPVQVELHATPQAYALTLLAKDRPALFATIAGVLAGWSMNIIKAEAFGNDAGIVLDTFQFTDLHRTLEMNPDENERLRRNLVEIVSGQAPLAPLLKSGLHSLRSRSSKIAVPTQIRFDQESSSRSTLLEILTQDRPGLLREIGSVLAQLCCNIEVALIDTEGHKAIDVFYLTQNGSKLSSQLQETIASELRIRI